MIKIYQNLGIREFTKEEFSRHLSENDLKIEEGEIRSIRILERKFLRNKGNALDGWIQNSEKRTGVGFNIGGNPIGTGHVNFIPFLDEMDCEKVGHLYILKSLIGKPLNYLMKEDFCRGYVVPKNLLEIN